MGGWLGRWVDESCGTWVCFRVCGRWPCYLVFWYYRSSSILFSSLNRPALVYFGTTTSDTKIAQYV